MKKRIGIIGNGRIGRAVIRGVQESPDWSVGAVLTRFSAGSAAASSLLTTSDEFFLGQYDLIIEAAGPSTLRAYGARCLSLAEVWTVSGSALADDDLRLNLADAAAKFGHRLRLMSGAMAGLDGVSALAAGSSMRLAIINQRPGLANEAKTVFSGSLREAAALYPDEVNAAVTAALAGPGIDRTTIILRDPGKGGEHRLILTGEGEFGTLDVNILVHPLSAGGLHPVAASILAALNNEVSPIRIG